MLDSKRVFAGSPLAAVFGLTGCGGGHDPENPPQEVVLNIPDPVQPVAVDVTIGGAFAGAPGNPPAARRLSNSTRFLSVFTPWVSTASSTAQKAVAASTFVWREL